MASTNKTTNLDLPQWSLQDKPEMADFNDANAKIDLVVSDHIAKGVSEGVHGFKTLTLDLSSNLANGWALVSSVYPFIATRMGNLVFVKGWITGGIVSVNTRILSIPPSTGFELRPSAVRQGHIFGAVSPATVHTIRVQPTGDIEIDNNFAWDSGKTYKIDFWYYL